MEDKDLYEVLQVQPSAEAEVIAGAYNRLARKYHPDVNKSPGATRRMQLINEAYEVLGDAAKRAEYDKERAARAAQFTAGSFVYTQQPRHTDSTVGTEEVIVTIVRAAAEVAVPAFVSWMQRQHEEAQQTKKLDVPSFAYPDPSATDISSISSRVEGTICLAQTCGNAYVDYGRSIAYESHNGPHTLSSKEMLYTLKVNLAGLTPDTTYHWRLRYVTASSEIYTGNDQVFTTHGVPNRASTNAAKTTKVCPKCGAEIARSALYCRECRAKR